MRVLVTGGAGFIGSNLVRLLRTKSEVREIVVIDDLSTGYVENITGLDVPFYTESVLDYDKLLQITQGIDSIVHLAAIPSVPRSIGNPRASHDANATGTLNVLEAARANGVGQVVVASSSSVYGSNPALPKGEFDWTRPMSPYAVTKAATEGYAIAYGHSYGLDTLAFRFFNVYGPRQAPGHAYAAVIPKFISAIRSGSPLEVHGDGQQTRDFTFVDTVTATLHAAIQRRAGDPHPVNLAFGTKTSLLDLIKLLGELTGEDVETVFTPTRPGDVPQSQASGKRIGELFPHISPVDLRTGLRQTLDWFDSTSI